MPRLAVVAVAAALIAPTAAVHADTRADTGSDAGPVCLPYGDAAATLTGVVYAMEAFDEAQFDEAAGDTTARERHADFYALVMADRVCVSDPEDTGRPATHHVTIVRLDMPAEMAKMVVQRRVMVQGPLARSHGAEGDPAVVMKVAGLAGPGQ